MKKMYRRIAMFLSMVMILCVFSSADFSLETENSELDVLSKADVITALTTTNDLADILAGIMGAPQLTNEEKAKISHASVSEPFRIPVIDVETGEDVSDDIWYCTIYDNAAIYALIAVYFSNDGYGYTVNNYCMTALNNLLSDSTNTNLSLVYLKDSSQNIELHSISQEGRYFNLNRSVDVELSYSKSFSFSTFNLILADPQIKSSSNVIINDISTKCAEISSLGRISNVQTSASPSTTIRHLTGFEHTHADEEPLRCWDASILSMLKYELNSLYGNLTQLATSGQDGNWNLIMNTFNLYFSPYGYIPVRITGGLTRSSIISIINNNDPIYMQGLATDGSNEVHSHAVVINGYMDIGNAERICAYIMDPAYGDDAPDKQFCYTLSEDWLNCQFRFESNGLNYTQENYVYFTY